MLNAWPMAVGSSITLRHAVHQILDVNELHQAAAVARQDDRAVGAQPVPEKRLAIKGLLPGP